MIVKLILKILNIFFVLLGIVFLVLVSYLWMADPFKIKPAGLTAKSLYNAAMGNKTPVDNIDKNPLLTEEQEASLESIGVDPSALPQEITPTMKACFISKLGVERTTQIVNGDSPTAADYLKAGACIN